MGHIAWDVTSALPLVFPTVQVPFYGTFADYFGEPINCRFTCWIPGFFPKFS
jgi:hypothetical protein